MARRQQKLRPQDILLPILLLLLAYVAPLVILFGWLVAEYRAKSVVSGRADHSLSLSDEIAESQSRIEAMWQDGQARGLNMRQDNMFDARFSEGRDLNAAIYAEQAALEDLQDRLEGFVVPLAQRDAMRGAAIAWVGVFILLWGRQPAGVYFWMSVWSSVAAILVAAGTYFVRKAAYENPAITPDSA